MILVTFNTTCDYVTPSEKNEYARTCIVHTVTMQLMDCLDEYAMYIHLRVVIALTKKAMNQNANLMF